MALRRVFVLLLILTAGLDRFEAVWGELRDGIVHHENSVVASSHAASSQGEHGHEHAGDSEHRHGEQHEHGTGADHCTHQHGVEVPAIVMFDLRPPAIASVPAEPFYHLTSRSPTGLLRPPRA